MAFWVKTVVKYTIQFHLFVAEFRSYCEFKNIKERQIKKNLFLLLEFDIFILSIKF